MARELVIMGAYVDLNMLQVTSDLGQDLGSDINFIVDPEAGMYSLLRRPLSIQFTNAKIMISTHRCHSRLPQHYYCWQRRQLAILDRQLH